MPDVQKPHSHDFAPLKTSSTNNTAHQASTKLAQVQHHCSLHAKLSKDWFEIPSLVLSNVSQTILNGVYLIVPQVAVRDTLAAEDK